MAIDPSAPTICVTVLAHNEERRIAACLNSLPLGRSDVVIHVVVNGSSDATAERARRIARKTTNLIVHDVAQGGKSRNWNNFLFETLPAFHPIHIFVDGDAEILPGAIDALADALDQNPQANAVAGVPRNGRHHEAYLAEMLRDHGLFGDLYGLRGQFLEEMKRRNLRLPEDMIGDDGLIGALAKTNLDSEDHWLDARIHVCEKAGFLLEPVSVFSPRTLMMQRKRMINYSVRHFQNLIISEIMRGEGPTGLPSKLAELYPEKLPSFKPRPSLIWRWFDRAALQRMAQQSAR